MATATVNGVVIAESDTTVVVEGNHYFPAESIRCEYYTETDHHTVCGWKGTASYYDVTVKGETLSNVAWFYPEPLEAAANITNHVAFYPRVDVVV